MVNPQKTTKKWPKCNKKSRNFIVFSTMDKASHNCKDKYNWNISLKNSVNSFSITISWRMVRKMILPNANGNNLTREFFRIWSTGAQQIHSMMIQTSDLISNLSSFYSVLNPFKKCTNYFKSKTGGIRENSTSKSKCTMKSVRNTILCLLIKYTIESIST